MPNLLYFASSLEILQDAYTTYSFGQAVRLILLYILWAIALFLLERGFLEMTLFAGRFQAVMADPDTTMLKARGIALCLQTATFIIMIFILNGLQALLCECIYRFHRRLLTRTFAARYFQQATPDSPLATDETVDQVLSVYSEQYSRALVTVMPHLAVWPVSVGYYFVLNVGALDYFGIGILLIHFVATSGILALLTTHAAAKINLALQRDMALRTLASRIHVAFVERFLERGLPVLYVILLHHYARWQEFARRAALWQCLLKGTLQFMLSPSTSLYIL
jgi:hypothetical protein